jgi:transposase-like protein
VPKYDDEFKEQVVRKMMPPNAMSVAQVIRDTGVSDVTLIIGVINFAMKESLCQLTHPTLKTGAGRTNWLSS